MTHGADVLFNAGGNRLTKNLTEGRPLKLIIQFTFPILLAMLFQQFYNLIDTMIVGKSLGENALAAVGSTGALNFMVIGFCSGVCAGFAIPMAHAFGANDQKALKSYIGSCFWLCLIFSIVLAVGTGLCCKPILKLMNTPAEILNDAYYYIDIIFWGIPATFLYNMLSCMIRSVGDSKTPVIFLALSSGLNIVLDLLLINVVHMGVTGAAIATVVAQAVSGLLCLIYIAKKFPILCPTGDQWKINFNCVFSLCGMGIPMGLQYSVTAIGSIILQAAVNSLGTTSVAAVAAATKLTMIFCCPFDALGSSIATYAGQNVGACRYDRVQKGVSSCMLLGIIYSALAVVMFYYLGGTLTTLFADPQNIQLIEQSREFLLINALFYVPLTGVNVYRFCIQGIGYSPIAILAGLLEMVARAAVGFLLVPATGYIAVCFASPAAWIAADCFLVPMYYHLLRKGKHQSHKG